MTEPHHFPDTLRTFHYGDGKQGRFHSLPALEQAGVGRVSRLPVSLRLILESVLRNCDGKRVTAQNVQELAHWQPQAPRTEEIPFVVARIVLQDFTGVPLLVDLAAMRSAVARLGKNPKLIEPLVPVDLVVDHSVQVDFAGSAERLAQQSRNRVPAQPRALPVPQVGHAGVRHLQGGSARHRHRPPGEPRVPGQGRPAPAAEGGNLPLFYPDTLVGTDSHTTMINGLGVVGWGVGGIEAEAGMLGQPVYFLTPDVVGVHLTGALREGVTATDLALTVTQMLRKAKVVGKFVEFFGPGAAALPVVDRATIANMAPEYGATMGFFPIDAECVSYLRATGRSEEHVPAYEAYYRAQGSLACRSAATLTIPRNSNWTSAPCSPSVAGPKRPQDRIELAGPEARVPGPACAAGRGERLRQAGE